MAINEIAAVLSPFDFRRPRVGHFLSWFISSQNWVRMIVGRTKPEIYALRLYQIEIEGFHFVSSQVIGGWDSAELQCFIPCCLWKWGFHTSSQSHLDVLISSLHFVAFGNIVSAVASLTINCDGYSPREKGSRRWVQNWSLVNGSICRPISRSGFRRVMIAEFTANMTMKPN
jgi:hypothetical protein